MALADRKEGDAEQLARISRFNKGMEEQIGNRLNESHTKVLEFFNDNPQLDVAARLLICDSKGQNKNNKHTRRAGSRQIEEAVYADVTEEMPSYQVVNPKLVDVLRIILSVAARSTSGNSPKSSNPSTTIRLRRSLKSNLASTKIGREKLLYSRAVVL